MRESNVRNSTKLIMIFILGNPWGGPLQPGCRGPTQPRVWQGETGWPLRQRHQDTQGQLPPEALNQRKRYVLRHSTHSNRDTTFDAWNKRSDISTRPQPCRKCCFRNCRDTRTPSGVPNLRRGPSYRRYTIKPTFPLFSVNSNGKWLLQPYQILFQGWKLTFSCVCRKTVDFGY